MKALNTSFFIWKPLSRSHTVLFDSLSFHACSTVAFRVPKPSNAFARKHVRLRRVRIRPVVPKTFHYGYLVLTRRIREQVDNHLQLPGLYNVYVFVSHYRHP